MKNKTELLERLITILDNDLSEARKMSAAEYGKLPKAERDAIKAKSKKAPAKRKPEPPEGRSLPKITKKKTPAPSPQHEPPSVGDLLTKSDINMGTLRNFTNQSVHPTYRGAFHQHLAYNPHEHGSFNANPEEYYKGWLHSVKAENRRRNPRFTPTLGGARFGNRTQ